MSEKELPAGWAWVCLADVLSQPLINGRSVRTIDGGFPVLRLTSIKSGRIDLDESKEGSWTEEEARPYLVTQGDYLLSRGNGSRKLVGRGGLVGEITDPVAFPDTMVRVRVNSEVMVPKFLRHLWDSPLIRRQIELAARTTAGIYKVNQKMLEAVAFPLPPLAEQLRIAEALEGHLSRLDAGAATLSRAAAMIPAQVRSLNTAATEGRLVGGLGSGCADFDSARREVWSRVEGNKKYKEPCQPDLTLPVVSPKEWPVLSLESVTDPVRLIRYGILMPKVKSGGTVPYVEVKDLRGCHLKKKRLHLTSVELDEKFAGARIEGGDIVMAVRGSYDRSAVVPDSMTGANVSRDVVRISPLPGLDPEFLQLYLQSVFAQKYLKRHARGVAVKGVNIASLRSLPVVVPPAEVQRAIIDDVSERISVVQRTVEAIDKSSATARALRRSLLARAFSGALLPQIPTDEPATALLARIQAERAAQPKAKRARRTLAAPRKAETAVVPAPTSVPTHAVQQEFDL